MLMIHIKKYYEGVTSEEIETERYNSWKFPLSTYIRTKKPTKMLFSRWETKL